MSWYTSSRWTHRSLQKSKMSIALRTRAVIEAIEGRTLLSAYHLTFSDEFNALNIAQSATDPKPWSTIDYWNNHYVGIDKQYYATPETEPYQPFSVSNGVMSITANNAPAGMDTDGRPWVSGQLTTAKRNQYNTNLGGLGFSQQYGYFEIRAKLPAGKGFFPAFWLMPADGSSVAEYDIFEGLGNNPKAVYQTAHWGGYGAGHQSKGFTYFDQVDTTTAFHTYGFEWNASTISWYVDGVKTFSQANQSNTPMYMIVNLALGGWNGNDPDATTPLPGKLDVDYIRVYSADPAKPAVTPGTGYSVDPKTLPIAINGLDAGYNQTDIGANLPAGSGTYSAGTFTLKGSGAGITGTGDAFHFASTPFARGDATYIAKVSSVTGGTSARGGLMVRDSWAANAAFASVTKGPDNKLTFQYRTSNGGTAQSATFAGPAGATWLRLTRNGNVVSAFYSTDGNTWSSFAAGQTISLGANALYGMAVTNSSNTALATATISNVSLTPAILDRTDWAGTASDTAYSTTSRAIDGDFSGAWYTGKSATSAMWFNLDLGSAKTFQRALILHDGASDKQIGGYATYVSNDGVTWTSVASTTSISGRNATVTLANAVTTRYFRLMPSANFTDWWSMTELNLATVPPIATNTTPPPPSTALPSGWTSADIGAPGKPGAATFTNGTFTVKGSGTDIWGTADKFRYASTAVTGDQTIIARVTSQTNTNGWAKSGIMLRDGTAAGAKYIAAFVTPSNGVRVQWRTSTNGTSTSAGISGVGAPTWLRLVRTGSNYTAYYATTTGTPTASDWKTIAPAKSISFTNATYRAGLAVTSHDNALVSTATFTDVSIAATTVTPPPTTTPTTLLSKTGWIATASSSPSGYDAPAGAIDINTTTRWSTGGAQTGAWLKIDMASARTFRRVVWQTATAADYIRNYEIQISNDGTNWGAAIASGAGSTRVDITLANNVTARYLRVVAVNTSTAWWGVNELNLYV